MTWWSFLKIYFVGIDHVGVEGGTHTWEIVSTLRNWTEVPYKAETTLAVG